MMPFISCNLQQAKDSLLGAAQLGHWSRDAVDDNLDITADFPYYWLQGIEQGIVYDGKVQRAGLGGMAVFANGCVGGLMTSLGCEAHDYRLNQTLKSEFCRRAARDIGWRSGAGPVRNRNGKP